MKNTAQNFYSIEYAWKKREHPKRGEFSPDFFIKIGDRIFVVEVKDDGEIADPSVENQKKFEYATQHFQRMNEWLEREGSPVRYQLNFLTPKDFNKYFIQMRKGELVGFRVRVGYPASGGRREWSEMRWGTDWAPCLHDQHGARPGLQISRAIL